MNALKDIYINKGSKNNIQPNIIRITGKELSKGVDAGYGVLQGVDFDSPDYAMREYLKRNVWKFSVAKNYNDSIRLSNLLVRKDGSLRPWSEFKREALMVVGESNRYLKTEYNTVVSGAQMSRMWQEIQRDKHIFPFVQFDVVKDGRTSDICSPLDKLIFEVDSPVLAYYFPPNHFNCRTRVRKLRNGVPSKNYTLPDIPTEFKNNAGMCPPAYKKLLSNDNDKKPIRKECGEIFTEENRYIKNTPKEVLDEAEKIYKIRRMIEILEKPRIKQFTTIYEYENGGKVLLHDLVDTQATDYNSILLAAKEFAKKGDVSEILPIINNKEIKQYRSIVFPNYNLNKNPDLRINEVYHDIKEVKSIKASQGNANNAAKQNAIAIIQYDGKDLTNKLMEQQSERIFNKNNINNEGKHNYLFKIVYFLHNGKLYKYNRD